RPSSRQTQRGRGTDPTAPLAEYPDTGMARSRRDTHPAIGLAAGCPRSCRPSRSPPYRRWHDVYAAPLAEIARAIAPPPPSPSRPQNQSLRGRLIQPCVPATISRHHPVLHVKPTKNWKRTILRDEGDEGLK